MKKQKAINIIFPKVFLFLLLCGIGNIAAAQTTDINSTDEDSISWSDQNGWITEQSDNFLDGILDEQYNITINGTVTLDGNLTISSNVSIVVSSGDTLLIEGDLIVEAEGELSSLDLSSNSYFIVRGNFINNSTLALSFNAHTGFIGIKGDYSEATSATGGLEEGKQYVLGDKAGTYLSGAGNLSDLVANESSSTRRLLLGNIVINVDITPESPTCHGDSDGSITVEGTSGIWVYRYQFDNDNWDDPTPSGWTLFTNEPYSTPDTLSPGTYTVYVEDDFGDSYSEDVTIEEKAELTFEVSGDPYFCSAGTGAFVVDVSGGNPPYSVTVTGPSDYTSVGTDTQTEFTFSNLSGGIYTISVSGDGGCPEPDDKTFDVNIDNAAPIVDVFPDDVFISYATFRSESTLDTDQVMGGSFSSTINTDDVIDSNPLDLSNYENGRYSFTVAQTPESGATGSDMIRILKSTDGGTSFPITIATYTGERTGLLTESIDLSEDPADNTNIVIRLEVTIATITEYIITDFQIIADERINSETYDSGTPDYEDPLSGVTEVESNDVVDWYCTAAGNEEFTVTRRWRAVDDCGNQSSWRSQMIHVGTPPTITAGNDTIIDYCNNNNISLPDPTVNDVCTLEGGLEITWQLYDGDGDPVEPQQTAPLSGVVLPYSNTQDSSYTVTWTVTDEAGFTATDDQTITVKPAIDVEINYSDYDFCSGEEVTFNVTITGGTGEYGDPTFSVDGTWAPDNLQNTSGTFTTSALGFETGLSDNFTVSVSDVTTTATPIDGECGPEVFSFTDGDGDFDIHENISTKELERQ